MRFQERAKTAITTEEEKGTLVLNVEFRDSNEQLVLDHPDDLPGPTRAISNRGRDRELSNVITYLKEQINQIESQGGGQFPRVPRLWLRKRPRPARCFPPRRQRRRRRWCLEMALALAQEARDRQRRQR